MTSLLTARRRAEEFAAAVDGGSPSSVDPAPAVADLVRVASLLRTHETPTPRAEFSQDLRSRLMTEAETVLHPESARLLLPVRTRSPRERRLVAAASVAVLVGGTASMAAAAQEALPGELLYPVKRGIEQAEAGLSLTPAGKGRDLLSQASDRLVEVRGLLAQDTVTGEPQIPATITDFASQADQGSQLLLESFRETRDPDAVVAVHTFAVEGVAALEEMANDVPTGAQDEITDAALLLRDINAAAVELCSTCADGLPALELPGIFLARAEVDRALGTVTAHSLDNSHPVVVDKRQLSRSVTSSGSASGSSSASKRSDTQAAPDAGVDAGAPDVAPEQVEEQVRSTQRDEPPVTVETADSGGLLPDIKIQTKQPPRPDRTADTRDPVGDPVRDPVRDVLNDVGELGDAVQTLLPDSPVDEATDLPLP